MATAYGARAFAAACWLVTAGACLSEFSYVDDGDGGAGAIAGMGGEAGLGGEAGMGGAPEGGGGSSGGGGEAPELVSGGVVVRYFLDEAARGQPSGPVVDAVGNLDLTHDWTPLVAYDEVDGHRGLRWTSVGAMGGPSADVAGTAVASAMNGAATATLEVVAQIEGLAADAPRSQLFGLTRMVMGPPELGIFGFDATTLRLGYGEMAAGSWPVPAGRAVLHWVVDSNEASATERRRLYVDGVLTASSDAIGPDAASTIGGFMGVSLVIGNRTPSGQSLQGVVFYAALYDRALSEVEVAHNAVLLAADDDSPR